MPPTQPAWLVSLLFFLRGIVQPNVMAVDWKQFEVSPLKKVLNTFHCFFEFAFFTRTQFRATQSNL